MGQRSHPVLQQKIQTRKVHTGVVAEQPHQSYAGMTFITKKLTVVSLFLWHKN